MGLLKDVVKKLAPIGGVIGGALGTVVGGPLGGTIGAALLGNPPTASPGGAPAPPIFGALGIAGVAPVVRGAVALAGNLIRSASGRIVGFFVGGRRISRSAGVALAKRIGLDAAAVALGVTAVELSQAILDEASKRRRRGGISASDLRRTRATICKVQRIASAVGIRRPAARRVCKTCS